MDELPLNNQPMTNSSLEASKPLSASETSRAKCILTLLGRLALHYYRADFTEGQAKLVMEDMISDLLPFDPAMIETACASWRRKDVGYFPKSGQLIACIRENQEASITNARAHQRAFKASDYDRLLPAPRNGKLKSWQKILQERRLQLGVRAPRNS